MKFLFLFVVFVFGAHQVFAEESQYDTFREKYYGFEDDFIIDENQHATTDISTNYEKPLLLSTDLPLRHYNYENMFEDYCSKIVYLNILCDYDLDCSNRSSLLFDKSGAVICLEYDEAKERILKGTGFLHKERIPSNFVAYPQLSKNELLYYFENLDFDDITVLQSNFKIQDDLYLSSECPICFDKISKELLSEMINFMLPSECGQGVIYEKCLVVLEATNINDPEGDEILNIKWSRTKANNYSPGSSAFYENVYVYGISEIVLDSEPSSNDYVLAKLWYTKLLGECCLFDIKFHAENNKMIFLAPEVDFDVPLTFGLQIMDSGTQEFGPISKMTVRVRDLDTARIMSEVDFDKPVILPEPSELCIVNGHDWNEKYQFCHVQNWVHCNGIGGELISPPDKFLGVKDLKICVF